ncbi:hypothetical protein CA51_04230 [Rosistilla oblonga]|nr:hypothetical protein CA51_04230 [Rosistilla oblonga]
MANVTICSAAEDDYTESLKWYAERSIETANDFDTEFDRALSQMPPSGFQSATLAIATFCCGDSRFELSSERMEPTLW